MPFESSHQDGTTATHFAEDDPFLRFRDSAIWERKSWACQVVCQNPFCINWIGTGAVVHYCFFVLLETIHQEIVLVAPSPYRSGPWFWNEPTVIHGSRDHPNYPEATCQTKSRRVLQEQSIRNRTTAGDCGQTLFIKFCKGRPCWAERPYLELATNTSISLLKML
jgi:hypothetical protein